MAKRLKADSVHTWVEESKKIESKIEDLEETIFVVGADARTKVDALWQHNLPMEDKITEGQRPQLTNGTLDHLERLCGQDALLPILLSQYGTRKYYQLDESVANFKLPSKLLAPCRLHLTGAREADVLYTDKICELLQDIQEDTSNFRIRDQVQTITVMPPDAAQHLVQNSRAMYSPLKKPNLIQDGAGKRVRSMTPPTLSRSSSPDQDLPKSNLIAIIPQETREQDAGPK
ncbi:hypothetical protein VTL71DRAFT_7734 [Oculimacula yallundae]|uniref:Uncharacterized protein n=1 Tax=Oculimacula yallundae TaxID=86028 RepID=A0ABR4CWX3_9HELO